MQHADDTVECGVYFTSSPGYNMYGTGPRGDHMNREGQVERLTYFWNHSVDDGAFFLQPHVQAKFESLLDALRRNLQIEELLSMSYGQGPFGESGGHAALRVRSDKTENVHRLADYIGYLLQQSTLYYYIGNECFVSRAGPPLEAPVAKDWTFQGQVVTQEELLNALQQEAPLQRVTVVNQPIGSAMEKCPRDSPGCIPHHRVTALVQVQLQHAIETVDELQELLADIRVDLPSVVVGEHTLDSATSEWVSPTGWSKGLWIVAGQLPTDSITCRTEAMPTYSGFAVGLVPSGFSMHLPWLLANQG